MCCFLFLCSMSQCAACWQYGVPFLYDKRSAPTTPSCKDDLLAELRRWKIQNGEDPADLDGLKKKELKYVFQTCVKGKRHPGDPTHHMGSMSQEELATTLRRHGLLCEDKESKGSMMNKLRLHWQGQCDWERKPTASTWLGEEPNSAFLPADHLSVQNYQKSAKNLVQCSDDFFSMIEWRQPEKIPTMEHLRDLRDEFVETMEKLIEEATE